MSERRPLSVVRREKFHRPVVEGKVIEPEPYLTLPFIRDDLIAAQRATRDRHFSVRRPYDITEGWIYSRYEQRMHGYVHHNGVDYYVPYGSEVVAPCDGVAMSSYYTFPLYNIDGSPRLYKDKPITFGYGYFVQIYNPDLDRYVQLGHLSDIAPEIPFSQPELIAPESWYPTNHNIPVSEIMRENNPAFVNVKRGDLVGYVGFSGVRWGYYQEYKQGAERPIPLDTAQYRSYDEEHVHKEEFGRTLNEKGITVKVAERDIYDRYTTFSHYPTETRVRPMGPNPILIVDFSKNLPYYADQV